MGAALCLDLYADRCCKSDLLHKGKLGGSQTVSNTLVHIMIQMSVQKIFIDPSSSVLHPFPSYEHITNKTFKGLKKK